MELVAGDNNLTLVEGTEQRRSIDRTLVHPMYDEYTNDFDIALVHVKEEFILTRYVIPVCLPKKDWDISTSVICIVTGWGSTKQGGIFLSFRDWTSVEKNWEYSGGEGDGKYCKYYSI